MFQDTRLQRLRYDEMTPELIDAIWALYGPHHTINRTQFIARLQELDLNALFYLKLSSGDEQLVGLAGIRQHTLHCEGRTINTIYLGQVYIAPHARRHQFIQRLVFTLFIETKRQAPFAPILFWVDALSYKPYLIMTNYLAEYYPHLERTPPPHIKALVAQLGEQYYGQAFDQQRWTIHKAQNKLKDGVADIVESDLTNPYIRFYASQNPGHSRGHGLLITCPLSLKNALHFIFTLTKKRLIK